MEKAAKPVSILLSFLLAFSVFAVIPANAAQTTDAAVGSNVMGESGTCTWVLNKFTGLIQVMGHNSTGRMKDYLADDQPWRWAEDVLTEVEFSGVERIGEYAFYNMSNVESLILRKGVQSIGYAAFAGCKLSEITLPATVKEIEGRAFDNNKNLTSITVPQNVTSIGSKAFGYYNNEKIPGFTIRGYSGSKAQSYADLYGFNFEEIGAFSGTTGDCNWEFNQKTGTLTISGSGEMADYEYISGGSTPYNTDSPWWELKNDIKSVVIGNHVKNIGNYAFYDCKNLTDIRFGNSVKTIGRCAFSGCGFESVTLPLLTEIINSGAFENNGCLTSVTFDGSVKAISYHAFYNCKNVRSVTIPKSTVLIDEKAFGYYYDDAETTVSGFTVYGTSGTAAERYADDNGFEFVAVSGTTGDCEWSFDPLTGVLSVSGSGAMASYDDISEQPWADFGDDIKRVDIGSGVTEIGDHAFDECRYMKKVNIGSSVTKIGAYALAHSGLTEVVIPDSVETIDFCAFVYDYNLKSVTFGKNVKSIGFTSFMGTDLRAVIIPDSVEYISSEAFKFCKNLSSVTIGKNVNNISNEAFASCGFSEITIPASVLKIGEHALGYTVTYEDGTAVYSPIEGFTVCGYDDTEAERYAEDNGFTFVSLGSAVTVTIGDVNGDKNVDVLDAAMVQKHAAGKTTMTPEQIYAGDVNDDDNADVLDAAMIQKFAAGKITEFKKKA